MLRRRGFGSRAALRTGREWLDRYRAQDAVSGSGIRGIGRHHGIDDFGEFSNPRGVFVRGEGDQIAGFYNSGHGAAPVEAVLGD